MSTSSVAMNPSNTYVICRSGDDEQYTVWRFDASAGSILAPVGSVSSSALFPAGRTLLAVGAHLLSIGTLNSQNELGYPYKLFEFDPQSADPLNPVATQQGFWAREKFSDPNLPPEATSFLVVSGHLLTVCVQQGHETKQLWSLNPEVCDPLVSPRPWEGTRPGEDPNHVLLPIDDFVLDWDPASSTYTVLVCDPARLASIQQPPVGRGEILGLTGANRLWGLDQWVLIWASSTGAYRLCTFDPLAARPLVPIGSGRLPAAFTSASRVTTFAQSFQPVGRGAPTIGRSVRCEGGPFDERRAVGHGQSDRFRHLKPQELWRTAGRAQERFNLG